MPKIGPIRRHDLIVNLKRLGFSGPHSGGKHTYMQRGSARVRIPNPHQGDISKELPKDVLDQAGVSRAEWEAL